MFFSRTPSPNRSLLNRKLITGAIIVLISFLFPRTLVYAQIANAQFATPNAAGFHINGQYPQASSTGVPNINVPVYDFSYQGMSLPIQLSYNTNSVKPNNFPGWVGLGWNLTAGGAVTRQINGWADDENWIAQFPGWVEATGITNVGFFYNYGYQGPNSGNWYDGNRISAAARDWESYPKMYQMEPVGTVRDYAPDEFFFSVGNLSGSFMMDHTGHWKVKSSTKVKVVIENSDFYEFDWPTRPPYANDPGFDYPVLRYLKRIKLIDDKGIKYIFGDGLSAGESSRAGTKSWFLTSIVFPNGKTVKYTYTSQPETIFFHLPDLFDGFGWRVIGQETAPAYLSSIQTDLITIQFIKSREGAGKLYRLDEIIVADNLNNNKRLSRYAFNYVNTPMDRLKLISVKQFDQQNAEISKHTIEYNSTQFSNKITANTAYPFYKTDHWGYFSNIPFDLTNETQFHAARRADTANCRAELLNKIIYPTGGSTQYTWAPHDYSKSVSNDRLSLTSLSAKEYAGGVRIKQINNYDINNNRIGFKRYAYVNGYTPSTEASASSSGVLSYQPGEYFQSSYIYSVPGEAIKTVRSSPHLLYSEVTEISSDGSLTNTIYSNYDNGNSNEYMDEAASGSNKSVGVVSFPPQVSSNAHERGVPLEVSTYTNAFQPLSKKTITYARIDKANECVRAFDIYNHPRYAAEDEFGYPVAFNWYGSAYKIYTNAYLPSTVTEKTFIDYDALKFVTTTTSYIYDPVTLNPSTITKVNSKSENINTYNIYPNNMVAQNRDPTNVYSRMVDANNISSIVEIVTKKFDTPLSVRHSDYSEPATGQFKPIVETEQFGSYAKS